MDLTKLRDSLIEKNYNKDKVSKFIAYLSDESTKPNNAVSKHSVLELVNLFAKYYNAGTNLDGVNVILAGKNMGLITYHGYLNKVKANHDVFFDVQLVREGDTFNFEKNSGRVEYSHKFGDPFTDKPIKGAYCVLKFKKDGQTDEALELLNKEDFDKMKASSRNQSTWNKWESEFWRKSVIKRACKVYFAEDVAQLEEVDNEDFGLEDEKADEGTKDAIVNAHAKKATAKAK